MKTNWDVTYKWNAIKEHYKLTANDTSAENTAYYPSTFWINHLTGSGGSYPYFVASGHSSNGTNAPRLSTGCTTAIKSCRNRYAEFPKGACFGSWCSYYFEGMAILFIDNYKKIVPNPKRTMGIIMLDFPGKEIIKTIINDNASLKLTK